MSDVGNILSSKLFWIIAMLCVLYYSAIFPFQRYATNMLQCNLGMDEQQAADTIPLVPYRCPRVSPPVLGFGSSTAGAKAADNAYGRRDTHDIVPSYIRAHPSGISRAVAGLRCNHHSRHIVLARSGLAVAFGA